MADDDDNQVQRILRENYGEGTPTPDPFGDPGHPQYPRPPLTTEDYNREMARDPGLISKGFSWLAKKIPAVRTFTEAEGHRPETAREWTDSGLRHVIGMPANIVKGVGEAAGDWAGWQERSPLPFEHFQPATSLLPPALPGLGAAGAGEATAALRTPKEWDPKFVGPQRAGEAWTRPDLDKAISAAESTSAERAGEPAPEPTAARTLGDRWDDFWERWRFGHIEKPTQGWAETAPVPKRDWYDDLKRSYDYNNPQGQVAKALMEYAKNDPDQAVKLLHEVGIPNDPSLGPQAQEITRRIHGIAARSSPHWPQWGEHYPEHAEAFVRERETNIPWRDLVNSYRYPRSDAGPVMGREEAEAMARKVNPQLEDAAREARYQLEMTRPADTRMKGDWGDPTAKAAAEPESVGDIADRAAETSQDRAKRDLLEREYSKDVDLKAETAKGAGTRAALSRPQDLPEIWRGANPGTFGDASLPMDPASRMQRARELGYNTDKTWWHGTPYDKFDEFKPMDPGTYFSSDPDYAAGYADVMGNKNADAYHVRGPIKEVEVPRERNIEKHIDSLDAALEQAAKEGYSGVRYMENGREVEMVVPTHLSNRIRSTDAAFDPVMRHSPNLLAAETGEGAGLRSAVAGTERKGPVREPVYGPKWAWPTERWNQVRYLADQGKSIGEIAKELDVDPRALGSAHQRMVAQGGQPVDFEIKPRADRGPLGPGESRLANPYPDWHTEDSALDPYRERARRLGNEEDVAKDFDLYADQAKGAGTRAAVEGMEHKPYFAEPLRDAVKNIMFSGKQRQVGTVRDVLPPELHKEFGDVLDTPIHVRDDPEAWKTMKESGEGTRAWYAPETDPETGERLGRGSIHISSEAPLGDKDFSNLLFEEIMHARRDALGRSMSDYYPGGKGMIPYADRDYEKTAKQGADYYTRRMVPHKD